MQQAILFALVAHVGWGVGDIFGAISSRKIGGYSMTFWSYLVRIPLLAVIIPFDLEHVQALTVSNVLLSAFLAVIALTGTSFFFAAFEMSNPSLVGTIGAAFVVPTVILSIIFFDERLDFYQALTIVVIVVGLVITTLDFKSLRQGRAILDSGLVLALGAMLLWGIYFSFIRIPVEEIGWFLPGYIASFCSPVVLILMRVKRVRLVGPRANHAFPAFVAAVLLSTAANFGYNLGISYGYTSIVAPIAGAYPILFVILSSLIFKDPLRGQQAVGIVISLLGIVALSLSS